MVQNNGHLIGRQLRIVELLRKIVKMAPIYIGIIVLILNDWRLGQFSFSDLFVVIGIILLFPTITKVPIRWLVGCALAILLVFFNITVASTISDYSIYKGMFYLAKIGMFFIFYILLYWYIKKRRMAVEFIQALISVGLVVSLVGLYISANIVFDYNLPYDFFWHFSRQDVASYVFAGGYSEVVRTRSIFNEPQHLGLFLNITLVAALLGNFSKQINRPKSILIIIFTSFSTFSFSTIPILLLILILYLLKYYHLNFIMKKNFVLLLSATVLLGVLFWQQISETIVQRAQLILSGNDGSASQRLIGSWANITPENLVMGSGVGQSPFAWNNYAYLLMDFGIIGLILILFVTFVLIRRNALVGIFFTIFCFQKGGYLSGFFLMMLLIMFVATSKTDGAFEDNQRRHINNLKQKAA